MSSPVQLSRTAGPSWGFAFLAGAQRWVPDWLLRPALKAGTWVAVARMPAQRRYSREFLSFVLGRPAGLRDVWRHFFAFLELMMMRLRLAGGGASNCALAPGEGREFEDLLESGEPALFGTFHFGHSDLLGFLLGARRRRVAMIRLRVENSPDLEQFSRQFGRWVSFIWVNEPANLLFAVKTAIDEGASLAMQCDRPEYAARNEDFEFLGERRMFPFTIYHLACLFNLPVVFCLGLPDGRGGTSVLALPVFRPDGGTREDNLQRARDHFQAVLTRLEGLVRRYPVLWFNFRPLNPVAGPSRRLSATPPVAAGRS